MGAGEPEGEGSIGGVALISGRLNPPGLLVAIAVALSFVIAPCAAAAHAHPGEGPQTLCPLCTFGFSPLLIPLSCPNGIPLLGVGEVPTVPDRHAFASPALPTDVRAPPAA